MSLVLRWLKMYSSYYMYIFALFLGLACSAPVAVWPPSSNLKYSQAGNAAALAQNIDGSWVGFGTTDPPITDKGLFLGPAVTNECYNYNAKPVDTSGIIVSTNNATAIRLVNDKASLITAGFGPAINSGFMNGNVFEFDYLGHYVQFQVGNTSKSGSYVYSMWVKKISGPPDNVNTGIKMGLLVNGTSQEIYTNSSTWTRISGVLSNVIPGSTFYVRVDKGVVARFILNQLEFVSDLYPKNNPSNPVITSGAPATHGPDVAVFTIPADTARNTVQITPYNNPVIFRTRPSNNQLTLQSVFPEPWYGQYISNVSIITDDEAVLPWTTQTVFLGTSYVDRWRGTAMDRSNLAPTFRDDFTTLSLATDQHANTTWYTDPTHDKLGDAYTATVTSNPDSYSIVNNSLFRCRGQNGTINNKLYYSCNMQTANSSGFGFQQAYGVFETRAKIPNVLGAWPAFWPYSIYRYTNSTIPRGEWDIFEIYPDNDTSKKQMHCTLNLWQMMDGTFDPIKYSDGHIQNGRIVTLDYDTTLDYHVYGGEINQDWTIFYADNKEVTRIRTFREWTAPMYILLGMSLSSGYGTPLMDFYVDYVAVYQRSTTGSTGEATTSPSSSSGTSSPSSSSGTSPSSSGTSSPSSGTSTSPSATSAPANSGSAIFIPSYLCLLGFLMLQFAF